MKYWAFFTSSLSDGAVLSAVPQDGPGSNKYRKGKSLKEGYPEREDAAMCFASSFADKVKLYDIMECLDGVVVVSSKAKEFFEGEGVAEEFLPVRLYDHQKNTASDDYFIFNYLDLVDFIDMENSEVSFNSFFPDRVQNIQRLAIKPDLETESKVFAPVNMTRQLFINDDFKNSLEKSGIQGYKVFEAEGWDGLPV